MGKYQDELRLDIQSGQKAHRDISNRALQEVEATGGFKRAPSLRDLSQGIRDNPTGFLPTGQRSNIGMMNYQGTPGAMYVNTPDVKPGTQWGTNLYPPAPVAAPPPIDTAPPEDTDQEEPLSEQLIAINDKMKGQGLPEFKTMQDFYDFVSDQTEGGPPILPPYMLANEGGLASLPQGFRNGNSVDVRNQKPEDFLFKRGLLGGIGRPGRQLRRAERRASRAARRGEGPSSGGQGSGSGEGPSSGGQGSGSGGWYLGKNLGRADPNAGRSGSGEAGKEGWRFGDNFKKLINLFPDAKQAALDTLIPNESNNPAVEQIKRYVPYAGTPFRSAFQDLRSLFRRSRGLGGPSGKVIGRESPAIDFGRYADGGIAALPTFSNGGMSDLAMLSKEELIQMIMKGESRINPGQQFGQDLRGIGEGLGKLFGMGGGGGSMSSAIGSDPLEGFSPDAGMLALAADGGIMSLADGGYPRMNGQISGPGTERSDDIPAMLSDGEFVVNAKAVRGIGNINGANGDKEDQRREGARMMYALQQAGEEAARRT